MKRILVCLVLLAGCGTSTHLAKPSTTKADTSWIGRHRETASTLAGDMSTIGDAANNEDLPAVRKACDTLSSDVADAQSDPIPIAKVQSHYGRALDDFAEAADKCVEAVDNFDPDELGQVSDLMGQGSDEISKVSDLMDAG